MANKTNGVASPAMMDAIRSEASDAYQAAVPQMLNSDGTTRALLPDVANPILSYDVFANEFLNLLVNKIVLQLINRRMFNNPLSIFKKGSIGAGTDIEDMHTNPADARTYDGTATGMSRLLTPTPPDTVPAWYRLNRQDQYPVTINEDQLGNAMLSFPNLDRLIGQITDSLYNGATIDEFSYTKKLVTDAVQAAKLPKTTTVMPSNEATAKQFQIALRNLSMMFSFPSDQYNPYVLMGGTGGARTTWTPIEDQVIIIRADVASAVGVEVLSAAFNISYSDYLARQIVVDSLGAATTLAVLADVNSFQIWEKLRKFTTFYNASALNWQYYYNCWDIFSLSPFYNITALVTA